MRHLPLQKKCICANLLVLMFNSYMLITHRFMDFLGCWEFLIVCTGIGVIVQLDSKGNTQEVVKSIQHLYLKP